MLPILASGPDWVVVGKPSGLAVHRSPELNDPTYLVQVARDQLGRYVWPVHRLDRPTSGCVWLSFDPERLAAFGAALAAGRKRYIVMTRGRFRDREPVTITNPMKDSYGVLREAETWARCLAVSADPHPRCSLVLAEPKTGRFHQIRRHLRDLSHPVLGDGVHGDSRVNRWWREERGLSRLGLHCLSLDVTLPDGAPLHVTCPVPDELRTLWASLELWDEAMASFPELA